MSLLELNDVIQRDVLHLVVNHLSRIVLQPQFLSVQVSLDDLLASGAFCAQLSDESLLRDIEGSLVLTISLKTSMQSPNLSFWLWMLVTK